jgi:hypothetical protein
MDCSDNGPAPDPGYACDLTYCATDWGSYGSCAVDDGTCKVEIKCFEDPPTVTGSCP